MAKWLKTLRQYIKTSNRFGIIQLEVPTCIRRQISDKCRSDSPMKVLMAKMATNCATMVGMDNL